MHKTIKIEKSPTSENIRLSPSPLEISTAAERSNGGGRARIDIVADGSLENLTTADKTVVFDFGDAPATPSPFPHHPFEAEARRHNGPPSPGAGPGAGQPPASAAVSGPPFTLSPGQTLTLTIRDSGLQPISARAGGPTFPFPKDAEGHPDPSFTLTSSLRFLNRTRDGAGHTDLHMEC